MNTFSRSRLFAAGFFVMMLTFGIVGVYAPHVINLMQPRSAFAIMATLPLLSLPLLIGVGLGVAMVGLSLAGTNVEPEIDPRDTTIGRLRGALESARSSLNMIGMEEGLDPRFYAIEQKIIAALAEPDA